MLLAKTCFVNSTATYEAQLTRKSHSNQSFLLVIMYISGCLVLSNASLNSVTQVWMEMTCSLLSQYMSVVSVRACPRPSVMWDLDVILAVIANINSQISSQMSSKCVAAPSNKKQTSRLSGAVWHPHTKSVFITHRWHSSSYSVHVWKGIYSAAFFLRYTQVLRDSNVVLRSTLWN